MASLSKVPAIEYLTYRHLINGTIMIIIVLSRMTVQEAFQNELYSSNIPALLYISASGPV